MFVCYTLFWSFLRIYAISEVGMSQNQLTSRTFQTQFLEFPNPWYLSCPKFILGISISPISSMILSYLPVKNWIFPYFLLIAWDFSTFSHKPLGFWPKKFGTSPWDVQLPRLVDLEPVTKLVNLERLSLMDNPVTKAGTLLDWLTVAGLDGQKMGLKWFEQVRLAPSHSRINDSHVWGVMSFYLEIYLIYPPCTWGFWGVWSNPAMQNHQPSISRMVDTWLSNTGITGTRLAVVWFTLFAGHLHDFPLIFVGAKTWFPAVEWGRSC